MADAGLPLPSRLEPRLRIWLGAGAAVGLLVAAGLGPVVDNDLGWHLQTGAWITAHHALPSTDPFSQGGPSRPWLPYSWLFELLLYGLHQLLGLPGIVLYRAAMGGLIGLALLRLARTRASGAGMAAAAAVLAALVARPAITERPWLFTLLFSALTLDALLRLRERPTRSALYLLPVYALWANLHVQFVYGLMLLGVGCAAPLLDRLRGLDREADPMPAFSLPWWRLVGLTAGCTLATLLNPGGLRLWQVVAGLARQTSAFVLVAELQAPTFRIAEDWLVLGMLAGGCFALGWRRGGPSLEPLLLAAAAVFGMRAERDTWLIAWVAVPLLASLPAPAWGAREMPRTLAQMLVAVEGAVLLGGALLLALALGRQRTPVLEAALARELPVGAVRAIEDQKLPGPLFNDFNWGGFLIWKLPRLPVSMDGRTNLYSDAELFAHRRTWAGRATPADVDPALTRANLVLGAKGVPLTEQLRHDADWRVAYEDDLAAVFVRVNTATAGSVSRAR